MHRYYWAAKAVTQLNQILMLNIEERVNGSRGRADAADQRALPRPRRHARGGAATTSTPSNPHAILETFLVYQQTPGIKGLSARTLRALYNARNVMDAELPPRPGEPRDFHADPAASPSGMTHAFRLMNQTSVLGRYLWVFRRIVGQMQHDLFHVYTVDQHILMVLRNVRRFFIPEHAHEYPFCSQLAASGTSPGCSTSPRCSTTSPRAAAATTRELGAREARRFCRDHGIDARGRAR